MKILVESVKDVKKVEKFSVSGTSSKLVITAPGKCMRKYKRLFEKS